MQLLRHLVSGRDFLLPIPALPLLLSSLSSSAFRLCKKKIGTYLTINTLFVCLFHNLRTFCLYQFISSFKVTQQQ